MTNEIDYKAHGFKDTGFGCIVRSTEISVWIVTYHPCHCHPTTYGVYVFHGAPSGPFWRNSAPLVRCDTLEEAKQTAERIFGITGSSQFAKLVNY
jgi:hypothetical protein